METNMKSIQISAALGASLLIGLTASPAFAEDSGWYLGGNYGRSEAKIDERKIRDNLQDSGFTTTRFSDDESDHGYKLFGGYQFNRHFAIEGGYFDLGSFDFRAETLPPGSLDGKIEIDGFNLDLVGILPLAERFSLFGRLGANHAEANADLRGSGAVNVLEPNSSKRDTNLKFGVGAQWAVSERLGLRAEAERYRIDDSFDNRGDIDLFSLGLIFRFGAAEPRAVSHRRSYTSPPPVPVVVPAPARTERYCHILDLRFEINADEIQSEDEEQLRVLARFLKKYPDTTALIEGHTDNVGSEQDNLRLSQRRADSVVNYLITNHGIAASRLTATGYGESRPLADNRTEEGKRLNRRTDAVIACVTDIEGLDPLPARMTMAMQIEFDRNKADVGSQYHDGLANVAKVLKANPSLVARIEGHADNSTPDMSAEISLLRARNVANYLADNFGIARSRLTAVGFGETRRFAYNTSAEGRQENRRVNIILDYPR